MIFIKYNKKYINLFLKILHLSDDIRYVKIIFSKMLKYFKIMRQHL